MKKILFVINTMGTAGAEKAMLELLGRIDKKQYEVFLYVLMNQGELIEELPEGVTVLNKNYDTSPIHGKEGAKHIKKHVMRVLLKNGNGLFDIGYILKNGFRMLRKGKILPDKLLWKTLARGGDRFNERFDLAISYIEGGSAYYVQRYVNANHKACFIHVDYNQAGYERILDEDCYLDFDWIYPVSDEVKDSFLQNYPEMVDMTSVFHNLLNIDKILKLSMQSGGFKDSHSGLRILTIGRLNKQKAFEVSIETMRILKDNGIDAKWYVLGEGDMRGFLEECIAKQHLEDSFFLLGNVKNPYPYLKQCDLYVHASKFEGKSIAIQEAQILGKPIVVSDCNGNREQVTDGYDGYICEFVPDAIADGIMKMIDNMDKANEMGRNAQRKILSNQESENNVKDLLALT